MAGALSELLLLGATSISVSGFSCTSESGRSLLPSRSMFLTPSAYDLKQVGRQASVSVRDIALRRNRSQTSMNIRKPTMKRTDTRKRGVSRRGTKKSVKEGEGS
jgi:hypothetical protein